MKIGSAQADRAYERMLEKAVDDHYGADATCPFCGCSSGDEDVCTECNAEMTCPECGSHDVAQQHNHYTSDIPECWFKVCHDCKHTWEIG